MKDQEPRKTLAERVREKREALGLTQAELAKAAKLSPGTIGDIEAGRQQSTTKIDLVAEALRTTVAYLRDGKEPLKISEAVLTQQEVHLIEAYRRLTNASRERLAGYIDGLPKKRLGKIAALPERPGDRPSIARNRSSG